VTTAGPGHPQHPDRARPPSPPRPPQRVRVVLARRSTVRPAARARQELEEQTRVGDVLVRGLVRAQLALALRLSLVVGIGLGLLPLVFAAVPALGRATLLGVPLPWLLLGVLAYPFLAAVGWRYVRSAERNERDFAELVDRS